MEKAPEVVRFNCTACGLCCEKVESALRHPERFHEGVQQLLKEFPYKATEKGACEKFDPRTRKCTIYETRPDICRVERVWERVFSDTVSKEEYFKASERACKTLQEEDQLRSSIETGLVIRT